MARVQDGDVPPAPPAPPSRTARAAAALLALVVLADLPGLLTRGDLVRQALLPVVAALVLVGGLARAGRFARADLGACVLLALPALVLVASLGAISRPALLAPAALARHGATWLALPALGLGLWRLCAGSRDLARWWRWTILAAGAAGGWVYVEALVRGGPGAGPFGRPGTAGPFLGALVGPALLAPWTRRLVVRAAAVALLLAGTTFTQSRTGMGAAALGLLLGLGLSPAGRVPAGLRRAALGVAGASAVAAALLLAGVVPAPGDNVTLAVRRGLARGSLALIAERPLQGHGLGSFRAEILRRRDLEEARLSRGREPYMAHHDVLQAAVEGGLPAGLLLAAFYLGALGLALRAWRRGADPWAAAALAATAALAAASLAEQVLPDPAPAALLALALATALGRARPPSAAAPARALRAGSWGLGLLLLAVAASTARDVAADLHLQAYRRWLAETPPAGAQDVLGPAVRHLERGALAARPDATEALYRLGVASARLGDYAGARDLWRRALEVEPGLSEARVDTAETYALEGRIEDARATLVEARRQDPTRYDLPLRQGHLAMGPEPVPGGARDPAWGPIEPLRSYNEAARLAPERFEAHVAFARVWRRLGDLDQAGAALREAQKRAPQAGEVLYESFHLAEAEGADDATLASILTLALEADARLAVPLSREVEACDQEARRREETAEAAARANAAALAVPDMTAADRAYAALHVRLLALLEAGLYRGHDAPGAEGLLGDARREAEGRRWRGAAARQRALLDYLGAEAPADPAARTAFYERRGNLLVELGQAAQRFDGPLSRASFDEGHLLQGMALLEQGRLEEAQRRLEDVARERPTDARPLVALARLHARAGRPDDAERALLEALRRAPGIGRALGAEPDLAALLERPAVRAALPR